MTSTQIDDLAGRTALVTGGSRGLGKAMVTEFARRGANVVIASRKLDNCQELAAEIEDRFEVTATPVAVNVSDWDQCTRLVDEVYDTVGPLDILVNNAGLSPQYPSVDAVSEALWDKVIGVNLKGPFRLSALVGTRMAEDGGGAIINISSVASVRPTPATVPYAAAKAGLDTLTAAFAQTFAPAVRVNGILCGHFLTDVSAAWDMTEFDQRAKDHIMLQRAADPDEIIGAAMFLASSASSYCTGSLLTVDGGMH
jgi:NAD(P)-dependent dehydrogenase (short-subunit alcohol dehydrogenase family)